MMLEARPLQKFVQLQPVLHQKVEVAAVDDAHDALDPGARRRLAGWLEVESKTPLRAPQQGGYTDRPTFSRRGFRGLRPPQQSHSADAGRHPFGFPARRPIAWGAAAL